MLSSKHNVLVEAEAAYAKLVAEMGKKLDEIYKTTGDFMGTLGTPTVNSIGGEWMVIGLARSGRPVPAGYYDNVVEYVKAKADANERLHPAKVTDNARVILALTSIGKDVTNVGGHNLLKGLDNMAYVQKQGINGPIFTLIALDSHNYPTMGDVTREKLIQVILDAQLTDGGWNLTLALACPAFRWPFGGKLDKAVFNRATSIYLPEATHHMLPEALGTGAYSLLAQKTRPSLLIECTVGADGLVTACEPRVGYARLAANLCYEDCETALDGGESPASPYLACGPFGNVKRIL